ncbi:hypothetical protein [Halosegnis longus]|uniref:MarR family transcriptional regulator n=1 Tax=Halosegnis longus TaxID=2216012 RepID=A0AAJ4UV65_9EURY|nr:MULTISPECIES: hypothetical protein [Halobacteriales]RNJ25655.1 MarR family transcriptional regulator [Salella cibi]
MDSVRGLSSRTAKLVYLYLSERGAATADELSAALDEQLLRLLPACRRLVEAELVEQRGDRYTAV